MDGSAIAVFVPTLALVPVSLVALAAFWLVVSLVAPVPYWAFAAGYLAAGVLLFLRPVQRLLLSFLYGARRANAEELVRLQPAWRDVTEQARLSPKRFVLAVTDSPDLNAYACGGHVVVVSTGALDLLPDDELRGVLAHELGHHLGLHTVALTVTHWLSLPIIASGPNRVPAGATGLRRGRRPRPALDRVGARRAHPEHDVAGPGLGLPRHGARRRPDR